MPVTPPDSKQKSLKKLFSYAVARVKECQRRRSICFCQYEELDFLSLDEHEDFDDHDFIPQNSGRASRRASRRARSKLEYYRDVCEELYQILHEDDLLHNPYLTWSNEVLIASLKQRGITLPRPRNKSAYALALQQADSIRVFAFMDLPLEVRLLVYEAALRIDGEDNHAGRLNFEPLLKPAILQTSRQLRQEGTAVFYHINRFVLHFDQDDLLASDRRTLSWMKSYVGTTDLQHLRHITLALTRCYAYRVAHIHIDLNCRDPLRWTAQMKELSWHGFSCSNSPQPQEEIVFMQERRNFVAKPTQNAGLIAANLAAANRAINELWETCGEDGKMRLSLSGLLEFIKAMQEINISLTRP